MVVIICGKYGNNRSRTEHVTEQTRFSKSRLNDLEGIGQCQRSSHATHLLMLAIICTKYGKNPLGTVDATERKRFSRPRPNDLKDIGQGQRSLYGTHPLILVIICAKYGKNPLRTVDFFQGQGRKFFKICQKFKFQDSGKNVTLYFVAAAILRQWYIGYHLPFVSSTFIMKGVEEPFSPVNVRILVRI